MEQFNKLRFKIINNNVANNWFLQGPYLNQHIRWENDNGEILPYDDNFSNLSFKKKTNKYEFIKCPVNPQHTSFRYLKLNKKAMTIGEVVQLIFDFYQDMGGNKLLKFKLENAIDIEEDIDGIVRSAKENFDTFRYWTCFLGSRIKFRHITEVNEFGFKMYQIEWEQEPQN